MECSDIFVPMVDIALGPKNFPHSQRPWVRTVFISRLRRPSQSSGGKVLGEEAESRIWMIVERQTQFLRLAPDAR